MSMTKNMKANKKEILFAFIAGLVVLFVVNNWTNQQAYDFISCSYNANDCDGLEWDGECDSTIEDACCDYMDVDMCDGQEVTNGDECFHFYCEDSDECCYPVYDTEGGSGNYICTCKDIGQIQL